jgi:dTDP-4-dehydrorhamnose 3,5-epimerase-like enzyme
MQAVEHIAGVRPEPTVFGERGFFFESYNQRQFRELSEKEFVRQPLAFSAERSGLTYQIEPAQENWYG